MYLSASEGDNGSHSFVLTFKWTCKGVEENNFKRLLAIEKLNCKICFLIELQIQSYQLTNQLSTLGDPHDPYNIVEMHSEALIYPIHWLITLLVHLFLKKKPRT